MRNYVFCKDRTNTEKCLHCSRKTCPSVSNILHGVVFELPIIKQIYDYISNKQFEKQMKIEEEIFNQYGDCENESIKLIFAILSGDEMVRRYGATLYTMNDLDVIYNKQTKKYIADVEAIYQWDDKSGIIRYLQSLLNQFTKYMTDHNLDTNYKISFYDIFYGHIGIRCEADTIEELYTKFKFMVDGYCRMWEEDKEKIDVD